jgi:hypothetical protein
MARTDAAVKLLGSKHRSAIEHAIRTFVYKRRDYYIRTVEEDHGSRAAGEWGTVTPTLQKGAERAITVLRRLRWALYDEQGKLRGDLSELTFGNFPMDAIDIEWWIKRLSDAKRQPARGRFDFDLHFAAELAGGLFKLSGEKPTLARSPNNKFVKLTGIICGRRLRGCPRDCQKVINKLRARDANRARN